MYFNIAAMTNWRRMPSSHLLARVVAFCIVSKLRTMLFFKNVVTIQTVAQAFSL